MEIQVVATDFTSNQTDVKLTTHKAVIVTWVLNEIKKQTNQKKKYPNVNTRNNPIKLIKYEAEEKLKN